MSRVVVIEPVQEEANPVSNFNEVTDNEETPFNFE
jgi:hypothetical protein